ncbi:50S ribosomal protein L3 [Candidatus Gracilibacteria bacterium]|nr:50S ribosomal protein L3 [Candidatus Gracilibacteria bacterium]
MAGILAKKLEMTRVVKGDAFIPVTLLEVPQLKVVGMKNLKSDGYEALIVGVLVSEEGGKLGKGKTTLNKSDFTSIREFPLHEGDSEKYKVGDDLTLDSLEGIESVKIIAFSKGKGFTGAMKKHNFHGGPGGHGSKFHRALGSIGNRKPTKVHKGKKMHGHHGNTKVNLRSVPVELINKELGVIGVRGPVPGGRNTMVDIIF